MNYLVIFTRVDKPFLFLVQSEELELVTAEAARACTAFADTFDARIFTLEKAEETSYVPFAGTALKEVRVVSHETSEWLLDSLFKRHVAYPQVLSKLQELQELLNLVDQSKVEYTPPAQRGDLSQESPSGS